MKNKSVNSPVKRGEIKQFIIEEFNKHLNDFELYENKKQVYFFIRKRVYKTFILNEVFSIYYSSRNDTGIDCGIATVFNENYITNSQYNTAQLNTHIFSPLNLKKEKKDLPKEEGYYFHNGETESIKKMITNIVNDFKKFGLKYLDEKFQTLKEDEILNNGLEFINCLKVDKELLKNEIIEDLIKAENVVSRMKNKTFLELKETLQKIPNQLRENKQMIPKLSFELLELYYSN
jgi:hypothetical protein